MDLSVRKGMIHLMMFIGIGNWSWLTAKNCRVYSVFCHAVRPTICTVNRILVLLERPRLKSGESDFSTSHCRPCIEPSGEKRFCV